MIYSNKIKIFVVLFTITLLLTLNSCEELGVTSDEDNNSAETILAHFGPDTLMVIQDEDINLKGGVIPFLENDIVLEGDLRDEVIFAIPGKAADDGKIEYSEMMALIYIPDHMQPLKLKEGVPNPKFMIDGNEFVPGDEWISNDGEKSFSGLEWIPEDRSALDVLFYPGDRELTDLFGKTEDELGIRENRQFGDEAIETDKKLAIAVPADVLFEISVTIDQDISEITSIDPDKIAVPNSGIIKDIGLLVKSDYYPDSLRIEQDMLIPIISTDRFFEGESFSPETNSLIVSPIEYGTEFTGNNPFLLHVDNPYDGLEEFIFFGGDRFVDDPKGSSYLINNDEELTFQRKRQLVMNIGEVHLSPYPFASTTFEQIAPTLENILCEINGKNGESLVPENYYYPEELSFPTDFFTPGTTYNVIGLEKYFNAAAIVERGLVFTHED